MLAGGDKKGLRIQHGRYQHLLSHLCCHHHIGAPPASFSTLRQARSSGVQGDVLQFCSDEVAEREARESQVNNHGGRGQGAGCDVECPPSLAVPFHFLATAAPWRSDYDIPPALLSRAVPPCRNTRRDKNVILNFLVATFKKAKRNR